VGEWTAGIEAALCGVRVVRGLPYNLDSARFGWNSWLFGRGGRYSPVKGILNKAWIRIGWGWNDETAQKVFRIGITILGKKFHLDLWP